MAKRRELKKNVNYIAGELFSECLINSKFIPGTDKKKADELMTPPPPGLALPSASHPSGG